MESQALFERVSVSVCARECVVCVWGGESQGEGYGWKCVGEKERVSVRESSEEYSLWWCGEVRV